MRRLAVRELVRAGTRGMKTFTWNAGDWVSSDLPGNVYSSWGRDSGSGSPSSHIDFGAAAGDLWRIPAAQACLNAIWKNFPQMPPLVQSRNADQAWEASTDQTAADLLRYGNRWQTGTELMQGFLLSLMFDGNGYLGIEGTVANARTPRELKWLPHNQVSAYTAKGSDNLIDWYWYTPPGGYEKIRLDVEQVIHVRFGLDPTDQRYGLAPMKAASRPGAILDQVANYGYNVLRNHGTAWMIVSPDGADYVMDGESIRKAIDERTRGDRTGGVVVLDFPAKTQFPSSTPETMQLETLPDRPEADICALMGVPAQVAGLHVGRLSKTYANVAEARESFWEETLVPLGNMIAEGITRQLLPLMGVDIKTSRLVFDISNVRPLQPDKDKASTRIVNEYKVGMIDRATALADTGRVPTPEDEDVYYSPTPASGNAPEPAPGEPMPVPRLVSGGGKGVELWGRPEHPLRRIQAEIEALDALEPDEAVLNGNGR